MDEAEFLNKVARSGVVVRYAHGTRYYVQDHGPEMTDYLRVEWVSGGMTGGSCWDTSNHYPRSPEAEPDFPLDDLLLVICPNISFLVYRKLLKEMNIETGERTEYEYYGNSVIRSYKQVQLSEVYKFLKALEII